MGEVTMLCLMGSLVPALVPEFFFLSFFSVAALSHSLVFV
jgi:hypothetical protein